MNEERKKMCTHLHSGILFSHKTEEISWALVVHTCNPTYLGGRDQENQGSRPEEANSSQDPHLQNNQSKMNRRCGSSGKAPALQVQNPKFKPQYTKQTRKKSYPCKL
jgi:hypothetical protein